MRALSRPRHSDGATIRARSVVLAQGVTYRRLGIEQLESLVGAGVYYGAAVTEAPAMRGENVYVVGGGNSAGQAALHLAKFASRVTLLVRGETLAESKSKYLIDDITRTTNIQIEFGSQIVDGGGDGHLEWLAVASREDGATRRFAARALFVLIGAQPATGWMPKGIAWTRGDLCLRDGMLRTPANGVWVASLTPLKPVFPAYLPLGISDTDL